jgi:hypothetical protein
MTELWFYSGRVGNCLFMYTFTRLVADLLETRCQLPKGTEITEFINVFEDSKLAGNHMDPYEICHEYVSNPKSLIGENDNMGWFIEKAFQGQKIESYDDQITISKIINSPDAAKKWLVLLGNFELGENYYPYRNKIKRWFKFPEIDLTKFEFFRLHPDLGSDNWFIHETYQEITKDDLVISLRLEDYTSPEHLTRLLTYDYFKIILESKQFNNIYIITNPGSIGHNNQYEYLKEFFPYNPIFVRIYDKPIMSMAFGAQFNNIAISQSTYSWWLAFLSNAENIYYPIPEAGPFSLTDPLFTNCDLRVPLSEFKYVDYKNRVIMPNDQFKKIDYKNTSWID